MDPEDCSDAGSCEFMLTWRDVDNDTVMFEMSAPVESINSWVAFGLSMDAKMVTFCWCSSVLFYTVGLGMRDEIFKAPLLKISSKFSTVA